MLIHARVVATCSLMLGVAGTLLAQTRAGEFDVFPVIQADVSPRLSAISQHVPPQARENMTRFLGHIEDVGLAGGNKPGGGGSGGGRLDGALQTDYNATLQYTSPTGRDGIGESLPNFTVQWAPPDTNMAVGPDHYIQWVNTSYAIFKKSDDSIVLGPVDGNTPWSGWNNACATNNDGDPIVQYDRKYDRWIFTQFSVSTKPYLQCVAVSTTPDPTGSYYRFAINFGNSNFPDYPKLGIWPTGYFMSLNVFKGRFIGPNICAIDRVAAALTQAGGLSPTVICKQLSSSAGSLLPADQDGPSPAGDPAFPELFMGYGANVLNAWTFVPNFGTPASSTVTALPSLPVATFSPACGGGACIPQLGTSQNLDSLGDRLMYRLAYRKVGTTNYLVALHSVSPNKTGLGVAGIRWYQLTATGTTPVLAVTQASTYAPDGNSRWMGSIAMDQCGNIGVGYSVSGGSINPGIAFAGRLATDTPNMLRQELSLKSGSGSQTAGLNRWGDYSSMRVDIDDSTFFFTTEYLRANGTFNWSTRISRIGFTPSCTP